MKLILCSKCRHVSVLLFHVSSLFMSLVKHDFQRILSTTPSPPPNGITVATSDRSQRGQTPPDHSALTNIRVLFRANFWKFVDLPLASDMRTTDVPARIPRSDTNARLFFAASRCRLLYCKCPEEETPVGSAARCSRGPSKQQHAPRACRRALVVPQQTMKEVIGPKRTKQTT